MAFASAVRVGWPSAVTANLVLAKHATTGRRTVIRRTRRAEPTAQRPDVATGFAIVRQQDALLKPVMMAILPMAMAVSTTAKLQHVATASSIDPAKRATKVPPTQMRPMPCAAQRARCAIVATA
jgi:hypothetical protein